MTSHDKRHMFSGPPGTSGKDILEGAWSLTSWPSTDTNHLHQCVLTCSFQFRLSRWLTGKESACNAGYLGLISGLGRSPGEGKDNPLQYSSLENSLGCIDHRVAKSWTRLSNFHLFTIIYLKFFNLSNSCLKMKLKFP